MVLSIRLCWVFPRFARKNPTPTKSSSAAPNETSCVVLPNTRSAFDYPATACRTTCGSIGLGNWDKATSIEYHDRLSDKEKTPMPNFPIVDAHVHLWDPQHFAIPWLAGNTML